MIADGFRFHTNTRVTAVVVLYDVKLLRAQGHTVHRNTRRICHCNHLRRRWRRRRRRFRFCAGACAHTTSVLIHRVPSPIARQRASYLRAAGRRGPDGGHHLRYCTLADLAAVGVNLENTSSAEFAVRRQWTT